MEGQLLTGFYQPRQSGKGEGEPDQGAPSPSPGASHPLPVGANAVHRAGAPRFRFSSVYFAINIEKEPLFDALVQGFKVSSHLDPFTSLRRRGAAAQLGKIYTYFYIMENSLPDIGLLTLICFLWKKRPAVAAAAPQAGSLIWQQQQQRPLQPLPVNRG